jgi:3-phenylpropionate/trans-cinnamate dioxygenase ferredoxin reductase subunit
MTHPIVIVGAGHAGLNCAAALRQQGYTGPLVLIGAEGRLPYHRPPLSKAFLLGKSAAADILLRPEAFYAQNNIELLFAEVVRIERAARHVHLRDGRAMPYEHLVLAMGSQPRTLSAVPGADLDGVFTLQTLADAERLKPLLAAGRHAVVVGAGFIGLEFVAAARAHGVSVDVLDVADRPMARVLSPETGRFFADAHLASGAKLHFGTGIAQIEGDAGRVTGVITAAGDRLPADLVLAGIGAMARTGLASDAGLAIEGGGVRVDSQLLTDDAAISAIGDVAAFPERLSGRRIRLESVQNATDQGRAVAARLAGKPTPYDAVPWFWSDQGDLKLQIAGLRRGDEEQVVLGDPAARNFSVLCLRGGELVALETVNRPADHLLARKLLAQGCSLKADTARAPGFELKSLVG